LNPVRGKRYFSSLKRAIRLWSPPNFLFSENRSSFPGKKGVGREVNHAPPSTAKVKNAWSYTPTPSVFFHGVDREMFTVFTLNRMTKFLADRRVPEYLLHYHICEFRAHAYYIVLMKGKSAISSQEFTVKSVTYLQVTAGLIKVFCHFEYCFLH
jgi:hypothetical protein